MNTHLAFEELCALATKLGRAVELHVGTLSKGRRDVTELRITSPDAKTPTAACKTSLLTLDVDAGQMLGKLA